MRFDITKIYIDTGVNIVHNNDTRFIFEGGGYVPKVKKEHFAEKENEIVDAAIRVCKVKPAYAVTMRDVVKECGISQGGIYCYFSDIDEIFAEIINRTYGEHQLGEEINKIFESNKSLNEIISDAFVLLGRFTDRMIGQYGNLLYELNAIYLNEPARGQKVQSRLKMNNDSDALLGKIIEFIGTNISNGSYRPTMPKEHILLLVGVTIQGIARMITFPDNVEVMKAMFGVDEEYTTAQGMMAILSRTIIGLLDTAEA